jgi:hypothetical protein
MKEGSVVDCVIVHIQHLIEKEETLIESIEYGINNFESVPKEPNNSTLNE